MKTSEIESGERKRIKGTKTAKRIWLIALALSRNAKKGQKASTLKFWISLILRVKVWNLKEDV